MWIKNNAGLNSGPVTDKMGAASGFTLLEVIISITILAFITVIISEGFRLGISAWERGESEIGETQRIRVISGLISQQLKSAYPLKVDVDSEKVVAFEGDSDSLVFVTTLTDESYGGFKWVRYSFDNGVLLYKEGILPDKEFIEKLTGDEDVIDAEIGEFNVDYYSSDEEEWEESWDYSDRLPTAVRVKMSDFESFIVTLPMSPTVEDRDDEKDGFKET